MSNDEQQLDDSAYRAEVKREAGLDLLPGEKLVEFTRQTEPRKPRSWRDGVKLRAIVDDPTEVSRLGDRWINGLQVALDKEDVERIRLGYVCAGWPGTLCLEPHETPFPDRCAVCGFPMRDQQMQQFGEKFGGTIRSGPSGTYAEDFDRLREESERRKRELQVARGEKPRIWVP